MQASKKRSPLTRAGVITRKYWMYYLMLVPVLVCIGVFRYAPLVSSFLLAFKDYRFADGIFGSPWAGLKWFERVFASRDFPIVLKNTIIISVQRLVIGFLPAIFLAIAINDLRLRRFAKLGQTLVYIPHFLSWVIVFGVAYAFLSPGFGIINNWRNAIGMEPVNMLVEEQYFRPTIIITGLWKELGWSCIIYLAALSGVDPQLYEAAEIDGASAFQKLWHITLPSIKPVVVFVLTLSLGQLLSAGFEQIFLFQTAANLNVSDTIETWVYRRGLVNLDYSFATAVGLFQSVIGLILVLVGNWTAKKVADTGIW